MKTIRFIFVFIIVLFILIIVIVPMFIWCGLISLWCFILYPVNESARKVIRMNDIRYAGPITYGIFSLKIFNK